MPYSGCVEDVRRVARGGHLINSGEMVPRDCPEENIRAYVETVHATRKDVS